MIEQALQGNATLADATNLQTMLENEATLTELRALHKAIHFLQDDDARHKDKNHACMRGELERSLTHLPILRVKTPIICNENVEPQIPGGIDLYATLRDAELQFEDWYVDVPHLILDASGTVLKMVVNPPKSTFAIRFEVDAGVKPRPDLVIIFLKSFLSNVSQQFRDAAGIEREEIDTDSIEQLRMVALKALAYHPPTLWSRFKNWWRNG